MAKKFLFWLYFVLCVLCGIYITVRLIMTFTGSNPIYTKKINIHSQNGIIDKSEILQTININQKNKAFNTDLNLILTQISKIPEIEYASVKLQPNGNLYILIRQKQAIATWYDGEKYYPITAESRLINLPSDTISENSVVFIGELPDNLTDIVKYLSNNPDLIKNISYIEWIENRRWNLHLKNKIIVKLPEHEYNLAIDKLTSNLIGKKLSVIDLRDHARILITE